jgi:hypothetical protein
MTSLKSVSLSHLEVVSKDMRCLVMGIRSEKCLVRRFHHHANVYLRKPR